MIWQIVRNIRIDLPILISYICDSADGNRERQFYILQSPAIFILDRTYKSHETKQNEILGEYPPRF
jgi:hypothetical protein